MLGGGVHNDTSLWCYMYLILEGSLTNYYCAIYMLVGRSTNHYGAINMTMGSPYIWYYKYLGGFTYKSLWCVKCWWVQVQLTIVQNMCWLFQLQINITLYTYFYVRPLTNSHDAQVTLFIYTNSK